MTKTFFESLVDGFEHLRNFPREKLKQYRQEGIPVDSEGVYRFSFGEHKEFEVVLEPFGAENEYLVAIYKSGILLTEKLHMKAVTK